MRKSLILAITAFGSGASYTAGATEGVTSPSPDNPETWRWHVSSILAAQSEAPVRRREVGALGAQAFNQRHERFTPLGVPQLRDPR